MCLKMLLVWSNQRRLSELNVLVVCAFHSITIIDINMLTIYK